MFHNYLLVTGLFDDSSKLPWGAAIPDETDPVMSPLSVCNRNSSILAVIRGSSIITTKLVLVKMCLIIALNSKNTRIRIGDLNELGDVW